MKIRSSSQHGATAVEFAVIAALLLTILFGILEYGLIFLQEHYVANAAREGARIAVRANNYDCDELENGTVVSLEGYTGCNVNRSTVAKEAVGEYLKIFYDPAKVHDGTKVYRLDLGSSGSPLWAVRVAVEVDNLFTNITPQLLKLLRVGSNVSNPEKISFTATMELEDQKEVPEP